MNYTEQQLSLLKESNKKLYLDDLNIKNIIFVYCPPKVGSTTLVSSIRLSATNKFKVLHIHDEIMLEVLTGITNVTVNQIIEYNKYIGRNVWVFDIYRSPIERKISEFFDKLASFHFNNTEENLLNYDIRRLIVRFNNIFQHIAVGDHYMQKYVKIDPKPLVFNFEKKYLMQNVQGITYIKLRLKDSKEWCQILNKILGTQITIVNDYETEKSKLSELYKKFKNYYKIPNNYLNLINNCPYLNYFYSAKEKEEYINTWKNKQDMKHYNGYSDNEYEIYKNICIENKWHTDIQLNHYMDEGCNCKPCSKKRNNVITNIRSGKYDSLIHKNKITHNEAVIEYKKIRIKILKEQINNHNAQIQTALLQQKSSKMGIINNIFGNFV